MRPHLLPLFPCLAAFLGVWQSVDFVNILKRDMTRHGRNVELRIYYNYYIYITKRI